MRRPHWMAALALAFAVIGAGVVALGLFGFKLGWFAWGVADVLIRRAPQPLSLLAIALALIAAVFALTAKPRASLVIPLIALALGAGTYAVLAGQSAEEAKFAPVHDVSTTWTDPPMPSAVLAAQRGKDASPVEAAPNVPQGGDGGLFAGRPVAEVNARTCPAAVPLTLMMTPDKAYPAALKAVKDRHLAIVTDDGAHGVIEATSTNFWTMKEDVIVRVRPEGAGSRIDIRAISRHGQNDRGHDCRRVGDLRAAINSVNYRPISPPADSG